MVTAIALRRAGFERADDWGRVQSGAGLYLWSNAMRALHRLDLADRTQAAGALTEWFEEYTWRGKFLTRWPVWAAGRKIGADSVCIARGDLHAVLIAALDDGVMRIDAECVGFELDATGVTLRLADGSTERGELLVGPVRPPAVPLRHSRRRCLRVVRAVSPPAITVPGGCWHSARSLPLPGSV